MYFAGVLKLIAEQKQIAEIIITKQVLDEIQNSRRQEVIELKTKLFFELYNHNKIQVRHIETNTIYDTLIEDLGKGEAASIVLAMELTDSLLATSDSLAMDEAANLINKVRIMDFKALLEFYSVRGVINASSIMTIIQRARDLNP